jgi:hypothetical protein
LRWTLDVQRNGEKKLLMNSRSEIRIAKTLLAAIVCVCLAGISYSQVNTAAVFGAVVDSSGHMIPSAKVSITNIATNVVLRSVTDEDGHFSLNPLVPGSYELMIEATGFEPLRKTDVRLTAGERRRVTYELQPSTVRESVEVVEETTPVNADNAEQRTTVTNREVDQLPLAKRDWTSLTTLGTGLQFNSNYGTLSMNGLPSTGFRFTADGVDAGGQSYLPAFSQYQNYNLIKGVSREAIEEVSVTRGIASADVGASMSGNVNVITRSGTNDLHGSAFWVNNVDDLNGRNQFSPTRQPVVYNQYGASLGGAIIRNRLFYFAAYEGYQWRQQTNVSGNVPTPEFRATAVAAVPAYQSWFALFPNPNQPYAKGTTAGYYQGSGSQQDSDNYGNVRVDYYIASGTQAFFRYTRARPNEDAPSLSPQNPKSRYGYSEGGVASLLHTSGRWLFETRLGVNYNDEQRVNGLYEVGVNSIRKLSGIDLGSGESLFQGGRTLTVEQSGTANLGPHTVKFGGNYLRRLAQRSDVQVPELQYANLSDFYANIPNQIQVTYGVNTYNLRTYELGFYVQDGWRIKNRLVINTGLRWDYFEPATEDDNRIFNRYGPFGLGGYIPNGKSWNSDWTDFSPRFSVAYKVNDAGTTVIRAGFGVFHSPHVLLGGPIGIVRNSLTEPTRANFSKQDVLHYGSLLQFPVSNSATQPIAQAVDSGLAINTYYPNPYSLQWTFSLERQFGHNWMLETSYVGNHGVHLTMLRAINAPDPLTGIRPAANLGTFNYYDSSESSNYEAWQTTLSKRFANGLVANFHYTWQRSFSYTDEADLVSPPAIQNPYNARADYGPSGSDIHHQFRSDFVYELPAAQWFHASHGLARTLLAGWQTAGIFTAQTGAPLDIQQSSGLASSRPDATGVDPVLSNYRDTLQYLNSAAFSLVPVNKTSGLPIRPGNVGRAAVFGPAMWNIDLTLGKVFSIRERLGVRLSADALNAFNHTNYAPPTIDVTSSSFGRVTSTLGARVIQISAKISF